MLNKQPQPKIKNQVNPSNGVDSSTEPKNKPTTQPEVKNQVNPTKNQVNPSNGVENSYAPTDSMHQNAIFEVENYSNKTEKRDWDNVKYDSAWDDGSAFPSK